MNFQETGFVTKCTEMEFLHGLMGGNMKASMWMIKSKVMEYLLGQMVVNMMVIGRMENKKV